LSWFELSWIELNWNLEHTKPNQFSFVSFLFFHFFWTLHNFL
jgi:hypothetical protein